MSLYSILVRILDEALSVCYSKRKKQVKLRAGGLESVYISVKGRVRFKGSLFQSFLHAFLQGLALVCSGEVSVIVRGTQGESQL